MTTIIMVLSQILHFLRASCVPNIQFDLFRYAVLTPTRHIHCLELISHAGCWQVNFAVCELFLHVGVD